MSNSVLRGTFVKGQPEEDADGSMTRAAFAKMLRALAAEVEGGRVRCGMVFIKDGREIHIRATFIAGLKLKGVKQS
jgi:hypothetical protein